jgi:integrase
MRQGDMLGLQWPDVDLEAGKITISRSLHRSKRRRDKGNPEAWFTFRQPKTTREPHNDSARERARQSTPPISCTGSSKS